MSWLLKTQDAETKPAAGKKKLRRDVELGVSGKFGK